MSFRCFQPLDISIISDDSFQMVSNKPALGKLLRMSESSPQFLCSQPLLTTARRKP
jgi:hypothetical protein